MDNFDTTLITDHSREDDCYTWMKTQDGKEFVESHYRELMKMAILAENAFVIDYLYDIFYGMGPCYEDMLEISATTSMENILCVLSYYSDGIDLNGRYGLSYENFVGASMNNNDLRVRRFTDRLGEIIDKDGIIPTIPSSFLMDCEDTIKDEVDNDIEMMVRDGRQAPDRNDEIALRLKKCDEILAKWNDLLEHACESIVPVKSSRK